MTARVRVCAENLSANNSNNLHVVEEVVIADDRQQKLLRTLNVIMIDAYLHDNVDYFYVIYDVIQPSDIDLFDSNSVLFKR